MKGFFFDENIAFSSSCFNYNGFSGMHGTARA